jgi:large subunit ribosomal protein L4
MAVVNIQNIDGEKTSQIYLPDSIYNVEVKSHILHQVVKSQLAARRSGTASVKNRADIKGSTKKLFRQKGTGNARAGSIKSPLRRGGGVVFGPQQKSWSIKVPKKVRKSALKMALSSKYQNNDLIVMDSFVLEEIKTKKFFVITEKLNVKKALVVVDEKDENLELSSRNLQGFKVIHINGLNVYDILRYNSLILLEASLKGIEGRLS